MKHEIDLESQMLDALELFQYAHQYRNKILVLILENEISLANLIPDLKVIARADIIPVVLCQNTAYTSKLVSTLSERGLPLLYLAQPVQDEISKEAIQHVRELLKQRTIPVIALTARTEVDESQAELATTAVGNEQLWELGMQYAHDLGASRAFILSREEGLKRSGSLIPLLSHAQLKQLCVAEQALNIDQRLLDLIQNSSEADEFDIVVLSGNSGSVFQDIFTHLGSGTLFTDEHPNTIRQARLTDVFEISNLTKPWVRTGTLLPINDDDIAAQIESFYIYTVNEAVVAAARLGTFGNAAQIARVCTLPRYRRRGYARDLLSYLVDIARSEGRSMVFGLSVEPLMWQLFRELGFTETPRELLPEDWKRTYDFSRPSKAFTLELRAT